ncbi:MAG TPA: hypothetical protein VEM57_06700 [Candidatus Binatus sp.]|nr:hypothetical protein [Candidatus Binatus sp.]
MQFLGFGVVLLLLGGLAHAHDVPINPSRCTFEPVSISAPASGFAATAAPPGAPDTVRIVYDPGMSEAQLCPADPADPQNGCSAVPTARAFSDGGVSGTVKLPLFQARFLASGDLQAQMVPVDFAVGAQSATVTMPLTTGLVAAGSFVAEGSPMAADGSVMLVGAGMTAALPAPLGGTPILLRMTCTATPAPDRDQFHAATTTKALAGTIRPDRVQVRAKFHPGAELPALPPDFGVPGVLRLSAGETVIAVAEFPGGLRAQGPRKFVGETPDGKGTVTVRAAGKMRYGLSLRLPSATVPPGAGRTQVQLTYQIGGLLSRATRTFSSGHNALRAP